ncbi:MAG: family serine peptidase, partial [Solirubrobacterales bacterium]|nr:family serine peptidase [Solirubrobacterales bacterium]
AGDNRYAYIQCTSMAAPMVAAVAAVVRDLNPDLSAQDVVRIVKQTASRPAGTGWNPDLGWGILNGGAAAALARVVDRRAPSSSVRTTTRVVRGTRATLRLSRSDRAPTGCVPTGIRRVEIYRGTNGGALRKIGSTTGSTFRVAVRRGSRYRFASVAVDRAGNREVLPRDVDTTIRGAVR